MDRESAPETPMGTALDQGTGSAAKRRRIGLAGGSRASEPSDAGHVGGGDKGENGAATHALRQPIIELGTVSGSDGSARFDFGLTSVVATLHGPVMAKSRFQSADLSLSVNLQSSPMQRSDHDGHHWMEEWLCGALRHIIMVEKYPRSSLMVAVTCTHDDGGVLAAALNAAVCALVDGGVCVRGVPLAIHVGVDKDRAVVLDPTQDALRGLPASATVVCAGGGMPEGVGAGEKGSEGGVLAMHMTGAAPVGALKDITKVARDAAVPVRSLIRHLNSLR